MEAEHVSVQNHHEPPGKCSPNAPHITQPRYPKKRNNTTCPCPMGPQEDHTLCITDSGILTAERISSSYSGTDHRLASWRATVDQHRLSWVKSSQQKETPWLICYCQSCNFLPGQGALPSKMSASERLLGQEDLAPWWQRSSQLQCDPVAPNFV